MLIKENPKENPKEPAREPVEPDPEIPGPRQPDPNLPQPGDPPNLPAPVIDPPPSEPQPKPFVPLSPDMASALLQPNSRVAKLVKSFGPPCKSPKVLTTFATGGFEHDARTLVSH